MPQTLSYKREHFSGVRSHAWGSAHISYLQQQSITPTDKSNAEYFTVTHCFHPLYQHKFKLVEYYRNWGQAKVSFLDDEGRLSFLPVEWTDLSPPDPFVLLSQGKALFRPGDLIELSEFLKKFAQYRGGEWWEAAFHVLPKICHLCYRKFVQLFWCGRQLISWLIRNNVK